jgi:mRNA interferase YafQ
LASQVPAATSGTSVSRLGITPITEPTACVAALDASKGQHRKVLDDTLLDVLKMILANEPLPAKYRDHPLAGDWADHRDCHVKPDLLLIYRLPHENTLQLVRLGSHSELGL